VHAVSAAKTALAEDPAGDFRVGAAVEINAEVELPEGVFAYETAAGTRYRFNAGGTSRRGFKTPEAALIEKGPLRRAETPRSGGDRARAVRTHLGALSGVQATAHQRRCLRQSRARRPQPHPPFFAERQLQTVDGTVVERWLQEIVDEVDRERVAPKTDNNGAHIYRRSSNGAARAPTSPCSATRASSSSRCRCASNARASSSVAKRIVR
jgi:hypothetical protein